MTYHPFPKFGSWSPAQRTAVYYAQKRTKLLRIAAAVVVVSDGLTNDPPLGFGVLQGSDSSDLVGPDNEVVYGATP